ncbi:MAG TPA: hypothetical protein VGG64_12225 [Pirellulales bacterium]|jgi:hypothetical protein
MQPPIFVDDSGDLTIHASVKDAESWLEPHDVDEPLRFVYDATGTLLGQQIVERHSVRLVKLVPVEQHSAHAAELSETIRRQLRYFATIGKWNGDEHWLASASLDDLIAEVSQ